MSRAFDAALAQFVADPGAKVEPLGAGLINDSWLVGGADGDIAATPKWVLQRLNTHVFPQPQWVMENVQRVTERLAQVWQQRQVDEPWRRHLSLLPTRVGQPWWVDEQGQWWRSYRYIGDSVARSSINDGETARAAGHGFGQFIADLATLADIDAASEATPAPLHETIAGFHDTQRRLTQLDITRRADRRGRASAVAAEMERVVRLRGVADAFADSADKLPRRIVHNDTKVDNLLFDRHSGEALCVVDLDTVMPGYPAHDFGDLVRNMLGNGGTALALGSDELALFGAAAEGFIGATRGMITPVESAGLASAAELMALELGVRFLSDYLDGDRYFKTEHPDHNLERCRTQLALAERLAASRAQLDTIIETLFDRV